MIGPILAPVKSAPLKSKRVSRAMIRAPENFAPLKIGASAREMSRPDETTRPKRLAFDRSAFVKFACMIQARSSLAPGAIGAFANFQVPLLPAERCRGGQEKRWP